MLEGQEACQLIILAVSMKIYLHCMVLMSTHLLVYGIVTKLECRPGAMEVLVFGQHRVSKCVPSCPG